MLKTKRFWVGVGVSALFLFLLFRRVDLAEMGQALQGADYLLLAPAIAVYFVAFWLRAVRWRVLLAPLGPVTVGRSYWVATIGYAANNVLPLRLGEFLRVFLLRRRPGIRASASLATIGVERVADGLTLLSWLGLAMYLLASTGGVSGILRLALQGAGVLFGGAALGLALVVLFPSQALRLVDLLARRLPGAWPQTFSGLARAFVGGLAVLRRGRVLVLMVLLTNGIWVGEGVLFYLVARALGMEVSLVALTAVVAASNLATSIPSTSGAVGPFEELAKETLVLFGIGPSLAAAYAILVHLTLLVPVTLVGAVLLHIEGVSLREAMRFSHLSAVTGSETRDRV